MAGAACLLGAGALWFGAGLAAAATTVAPTKTAWYDTSGSQNVTGETTPSAAQKDELEVGYVPAQATTPQQTVPSTPGVPGAPVAPPQGNVGGNSVGNTVAFAAVEYDAPSTVGGQPADPTSITAKLVLTLDTTSSSGVANGDLIACPTRDTLWTAGGAQDSAQAPAYSCGTAAVPGTVDSTAHTVTFSLTSAQENGFGVGVFSEVIVPAASPSGPFQAVFTAPAADSFTVLTETAGSDIGSQSLDTTPSPAGDQNLGDLGGNPGAFGLQSFTPMAGDSLDTTPGAAGGPSGGSGTGNGGSRPTTAYAAAPAGALHGGIGAQAQRTVAVLVLLAIGALLMVASSRNQRAPMSLRRMLVPVRRADR